MALDVENLAQKEVAGLPLWVWVIGGIGGLWIGRSLLGGGGGAGNASPTQLVTGNTTGSSASTCPDISQFTCNAGETKVFTTGPDGCPVPSCQASGSSGNGGGGGGGDSTAVCYTVVHGDNLTEIANKEGTPGGWKQLQAWNGSANACNPTGYATLLVDPNLIYAGWVLRVR